MTDIRKEVVQATNKNRLFDFIANNYNDLSKYELKEIILTILGVCYDKCCGDEDEEALMNLIIEEFESRGFGIEEEE